MFHFLRLFHNKSPLSLSHLKLTVKHWGDSVRRPESWTLLFVSGFLQTWVQYRSAGVCYGLASAVTRHRGAGPAWLCSGAGPSPVRLGSSQDGRKVLVENSICSSKSSKVKRWETRRNWDIKLRSQFVCHSGWELQRRQTDWVTLLLFLSVHVSLTPLRPDVGCHVKRSLWFVGVKFYWGSLFL